MTTTPGPEVKDMLGPGQEDIFDDFVKEVEEQQANINQPETQDQTETNEELIGGKFKSTDDLLKAYQEAERKLSEGKQETQESQAPDNWPEKPEEYTRELGIEFYGEDVTNALEKAEVNPVEMSSKFWSGQNVDKEIDALVDKGGIPRKLVDAYLQGRTKQETPQQQQAEAPGLNKADADNIINSVGGEQSFNQMTEWMRNGGINETELATYNMLVDGGNLQVAESAVRNMMNKFKGINDEPKLISGGTSSGADVFNSKDQAIAAISAIDKQTGRRKYDVDPKYRKWVETTMERSPLTEYDF
tara:strand:+ start:572 stop:1477 length:906 start_codon:yes stop_codon:yes gene_type:complete